MTTQTTEKTLPPPIPDVPFLLGIHSGDGLVHAIPRYLAVSAVELDKGDGWTVRTGSLCHASVVIAREWGEFRRGTTWTDQYAAWGDLCPYCAWGVALCNGTTDEELAAITPTAAQMMALTRLMPDPLIAVSTCRSILARRDTEVAAGEQEPDSTYWAHLLAHVTRHQPVALLPESCVDGDCDSHDCDGDSEHDEAACYAASGTVGCAACSVITGDWAGGWSGQYECTVSSPCSALLAAAEQYGKGIPA